MELYCLTTGVLGVNTYFAVNEQTRETIVIDAGEKYEEIMGFAKERNLKLKCELLTHSHFNHSGNAGRLSREGIKVYCSEKEKEKLLNGETLSSDFGKTFDKFVPDGTFSDGETLSLCGFSVKVILTPGHTDGSCCFIIENKIFSGDTVFAESFGRTDFPTGSFEEMKNSFRKIFSLKGEYDIYPGHGEKTTLSHEKKYNVITGAL